jgi:hypothetical protein
VRALLEVVWPLIVTVSWLLDDEQLREVVAFAGVEPENSSAEATKAAITSAKTDRRPSLAAAALFRRANRSACSMSPTFRGW